MRNYIKMMSIPELDKAKILLSALQGCHDLVYGIAKDNNYPECYKEVLNGIQNEIDKTEEQILSIEKEYGGNDGRY